MALFLGLASATEEVKEEKKEVKTSDVISLTDGDFEHLTQATTGSTTGDWFVEV